VVCTMHIETRRADFLVEPQNQDRRFVSGFEAVCVTPHVSNLHD
jgi:hypothetical protein